MTNHNNDHHQGTATATASLLLRNFRKRQFGPRRRTKINCSEFPAVCHRSHISALYPTIRIILIAIVFLPAYSGYSLLPVFNFDRVYRRDPVLCQKSCMTRHQLGLQQDANNGSDDADTSSSATGEEILGNAANYIPDDNDTSKIADSSDVGRNMASESESDGATAIDSATTYQDNMTDRFKYKVNALMGAFDPIDTSKDTETTSGNILNALLKFPVKYTFHVVGKTSGDAAIQSLFVEQVKNTIIQASSTPIAMDNNDDDVRYEITERGTKYTKVSIQKEVVNAEEITFIYDQLSKLNLSVMQF